MSRCNKKEKERLLMIEPDYLLSQPFQAPDTNNYLRFRTEVNNTLKVVGAHATSKDLWYSYELKYWHKINTTTTTNISMTAGQTVYMRGLNNSFNDYDHITRIDATQNIYAEGNIMSIVDKKGETDVIPADHFFRNFLASSKLKSAPELPATTLTKYCYAYLFLNAKIEESPVLPAMVLAEGCYCGMYQMSSLIEAPELPATTLAVSCYQYMFSRCPSLVKAPSILPATNLYESCYEDMFSYNYSSLTTGVLEISGTNSAPKCFMNMFTDCEKIETPIVIKSTTMSTDSHVNMFYGAKKINNVTVYVNTWDTNKATRWLETVAASGHLYNINGATIPTGTNGCPSGWTQHVPVTVHGNVVNSTGTVEIPQNILSGTDVEIIFKPSAINETLYLLKDNDVEVDYSNVEYITDNGNSIYKYKIINIQGDHTISAQFIDSALYETNVTKTQNIGNGSSSTSVYASDYVSVSHCGSINADFGVISLPDENDITINSVSCTAKATSAQLCSGNGIVDRIMSLNNMGSNTSWNSGSITTLNVGSSWTKSMFTNLKLHVGGCAAENNICTGSQGSIKLYGATLTINYDYNGPVYDINSAKIGSGQVSKDMKFIKSGCSYLYYAQPDQGYHISSVTLDGNAITLSEDGTYLLSNITTDHTFNVVFEQDQA